VIALLSGILVNGCAHFVPFHTINWAFHETGTFKTSENIKLGFILATLAMLLVLASVPFWGLIGI